MVRSIFGGPFSFQDRMEEDIRRLNDIDEGMQLDVVDDQTASGVKNAHQTLLAIKRLISDYEATHKGE